MTKTSQDHLKSPATAWGCGRAFFIAFGLVFLAVGCGMAVWIGKEVYRTLEPWWWEPALCTVEASQTIERPAEFIVEICYSYERRGEVFRSTTISQKPTAFSDLAQANAFKKRYQPGGTSKCFVDPESPQESVLIRNSLWHALLLLFPLPFIGFALLVLLLGFFGQAVEKDHTEKPPENRTLSRPGRKGLIFTLAFLSVFVFVGAGLFWIYGLNPVLKSLSARTWVEREALIESSRVIRSEDDVKAFIIFAYEYQSQRYRSSNYSFLSAPNTFEDAHEIVERYPAGVKIMCLVNPAKPEEAVLDRRLINKDTMLVGGVGLLFMLVGLAAMWGVSKSPVRAGAGRSQVLKLEQLNAAACEALTTVSREQWRPRLWRPPQAQPAGDYLLEPLISAKSKVGCTVTAALLWNAVIGPIVFFNVSQGNWFTLLFLSPFVAVGLFLIGAVFYFSLALRNPRPRLLVTYPCFFPGDHLNLRYEFQGKTERLKSLAIELLGREEATYRHGTESTTTKNVFYRRQLQQTSEAAAINSGNLQLAIPELMHSFQAENNAISWSLEVHAAIRGAPDVKESFLLLVLPAALKEACRG